MRRSAASIPFLLALAAAPAARAAALCDRLFVPEGYTLVCETRVEDGQRSERLVVRPKGVTATPLAGLTVQALDQAQAPLAWSDPDRWLSEQVSVDVSGLSGALRDYTAASGALAHPAAKATVDGLITMLAGWSQLPLEACTPDDAQGRHQLRCSWGVDPLQLRSTVRLVEGGSTRYAIRYWAPDDQRLRHFEAMANSFQAG